MTPVADPIAHFATTLADNVEGRRVLERPGHGIETEPATLAQLPAMTRIHDGLRGLRASGSFAAAAAEQASTAIVTALVHEAAANPERQVAAWPAAADALTKLADLVDALAADTPR